MSIVGNCVNIDASLNALISTYPDPMKIVLYYLSGSKKFVSKREYCDILRNGCFLHHNVSYGIPFPTKFVNYIYSSHLIEHLYRDEASQLLSEIHRVLRNGGITRICVPDLEYDIILYYKGLKEEALEYSFPPSYSRILGRHHYMYDFELMGAALAEAGFRRRQNCAYQQGKVPDIDILDIHYSSTIYVETIKLAFIRQKDLCSPSSSVLFVSPKSIQSNLRSEQYLL